MTRRQFVVLDRDGTLIVGRHYLADPGDVELLDGAPAALRQLRDSGFGLIVVTNQSAIGRGIFDLPQLDRIHRRLVELLDAENIVLDGLYFCPHTPDDGCDCRKPSPGMVLRAADELDIDLERSVIVGDNACDIELGRRLGLTTILVRTGYGAQIEEQGAVLPDYVVDDLPAAADTISRLDAGRESRDTDDEALSRMGRSDRADAFDGRGGSMAELTACRVCDGSDLTPVIDLGDQPWCGNFLKREELGTEPTYPLRVVWCSGCGTAQLDYTVSKEVMFGDHTYLSGSTKTLSNHFRSIANDIDSRFLKERDHKVVLDIGSNDGTQLKHFRDLGYDVRGVEPSKTIAGLANDAGIQTVNAFFDLDLARDMGRVFNVINAAGVFFHLEELHGVTEGIRECLREDGVFVIQFLYMHQIIKNLAFDQIYHEHLLYYNLKTLETLLGRHGLALFDAYLSSIHGGSMIAFACHTGHREESPRLSELLQREDDEGANNAETYRRFADRIDGAKERNLRYLAEAERSGRTVFGLGAPAKGNTLLNYFHIGPDLIRCLVEINPLRRDLFSPGSHIPIVMEDELEQPPDIYYVLAWNFKKEILAKNGHLLERGVEFFFPVDPKEV